MLCNKIGTVFADMSSLTALTWCIGLKTAYFTPKAQKN